MAEQTGHPKVPKTNSSIKHQKSISYKISRSVLAVLIPALAVLITISCIVAANTISDLNRKTLDVQTDYAISCVDNFFSSKLAAVSMYAEDDDIQDYFLAVSRPEDIAAYENRNEVLKELSGALKRMSEEKVLEAWVADVKTDQYLLADGEVVNAGLKDTIWYEQVLADRKAMVSDPYLDPATGKSIVSVVTPVFADGDGDGEAVIGFMGFDVYASSLSELLGGIRVGESGYLELLSSEADYIYSTDPDAVGKNVDELDITQEYKDNVRSRQHGNMNFTYKGVSYTAVFCNSTVTDWLAIATLPISEVNATRNSLIAILAVVSVVILVILIIVILAMIRRIMRPLTVISSNMEAFAQGNLQADILVVGEDEIGRMADSVRSSTHSLKEMIENVSHVLEEISTGNLRQSVDGDYIGDFRFIREALEKIVGALNFTLRQIHIAAEQVSCGAEQVSSGAQTLSQGAADQAGTVEELAVSVNEISRQITSAADNAADANGKAYAVGNEATESSLRMQEMLAAMADINESSREIAKVVKSIEDIAFQTNLLALNASVEAARAGEAGRGFAVVAGEIRSLASKSSQASKNTAALLENSLQAVKNGARIADETAGSLEKVVEGVKMVVNILDGISASSREQAMAVEQVNQGIEQISCVVQMNSATAEESAAASQELSAQALMLEELIGKFRLKE